MKIFQIQLVKFNQLSNEFIHISDSREKAYVHAISAAGVAYSITRACSRGELPSCSCDKNVHRRSKNKVRYLLFVFSKSKLDKLVNLVTFYAY